jgi:hypothetical protein
MAYGVPRTTADLDVTLEPVGTTAALVRELAIAGFRATISDPAFVAETRVLPLVHEATGWALDVVLSGPGLEELFHSEARSIAFGRRKFPVIAPEHLIATKLIAGRPKDLEDVRGLLRQPDLELDRSGLDELLAIIEQALDVSDLRARLANLAPKPRRR